MQDFHHDKVTLQRSMNKHSYKNLYAKRVKMSMRMTVDADARARENFSFVILLQRYTALIASPKFQLFFMVENVVFHF
jgi:hypothetical protein